MSGGGGFDELSRFLADLCDSAVGLQESTSTPYLSFSASSSNCARISQGAFKGTYEETPSRQTGSSSRSDLPSSFPPRPKYTSAADGKHVLL